MVIQLVLTYPILSASYILVELLMSHNARTFYSENPISLLKTPIPSKDIQNSIAGMLLTI